MAQREWESSAWFVYLIALGICTMAYWLLRSSKAKELLEAGPKRLSFVPTGDGGDQHSFLQHGYDQWAMAAGNGCLPQSQMPASSALAL